MGGGGGGSRRPKNVKKYMKLNWNFQRGRGVLYFLELHSVARISNVIIVLCGDNFLCASQRLV